MATSQSLLGLVSQLHNMDEVVNTTLMELALKLSSLTDASIFLLVETQEGRRFAGKRHLCDAYARNCLSPLATDVELEFDPTVSALHHRSTPTTPADFQFSSLYENHPPQQHHRGALSKSQSGQHHLNDRKRPHSRSRSPSTPHQPQQQQQQLKRQRLSQDEFKNCSVKREDEKEGGEEEEDEEVKVEAEPATNSDDGPSSERRIGDGGSGAAEYDAAKDADNDVVVEEYPPSASRANYETDGGGGGGGYSVDGAGGGSSLALYDAGGGGGGGHVGIFDNDPKRYPNKLSALEGFSLPELAGEHPVASKIFKSCLYDFAKTVASDFVATLASTRKAYVPAEGNVFIRQKFQLWTRQHPLIQNVYASGMKLNSKRPDGNSVSSDSTMWNYVRNAFSINLKRQLRIASFKTTEEAYVVGRFGPGGGGGVGRGGSIQ